MTILTPLGSAPGVAVAPAGPQYVFWKGTDNNLQEGFWDGTRWNGPTGLGMGPLGSEPTAGVDGQNRQYVFWKGTDNGLWEAWWDGTRWNGPIALGMGPLGSAPGVAVAAAGMQYVFWKGTDNGLWEAWWDGTRWNGPTELGMGPLGSKPTAGVDGQNRQYVFWTGTDNGLSEAFWDGTRWNGPIALDMGPLGSAPGVAVAAAGMQYVFWKGTDNGLWEGWWDGTRWNGPTELGMGPLGSEPTAGVDGQDRQYVFWTGTDNGLSEAWWDGTRWNGQASVSSAFTPTLSAETRPATNVSGYQATLNGTVFNPDAPNVEWIFLLGTTQANATMAALGGVPAQATPWQFSELVANLIPNTTYTFQIRAGQPPNPQAPGSVGGAFLSFTTPSPTPLRVATGPATNVSMNQATLTGTLYNNGGPGVTFDFLFGTSEETARIVNGYVPPEYIGAQPVGVTVNGLAPQTTYTVALRASGAGQATVTGTFLSFTTASPPPPPKTGSVDWTLTRESPGSIDYSAGPIPVSAALGGVPANATITGVKNLSEYTFSVAHGGAGAQFVVINSGATVSAFNGQLVTSGDWSAQYAGSVDLAPASMSIQVNWQAI
jgi:hypothetical protein